MRVATLGLIVILTFLTPARAEYRAYELAITNAQSGQTRTVTTTLDHLQYSGYYPIAQTEVVEILSTWKCWRRSDHFKSICPNPTAEAAATKSAEAGPTTNSSRQVPPTP
jgi:hypothetical protein